MRLYEASEGGLDRELHRGRLEGGLGVESTELCHCVHELGRPRGPIGVGLAIVLHRWLHEVGVARPAARGEIVDQGLR